MSSIFELEMFQIREGETLLSALASLELEIVRLEKKLISPSQSVVAAELLSVEQEIDLLREYASTPSTNRSEYSETMDQLLASIDLYGRPEKASENEDFIANINRKEMRRFELGWLQNRRGELRKQNATLIADKKRLNLLNDQVKKLLEDATTLAGARISNERLERQLSAALAIREASQVAMLRTRSAAEHAHNAAKLAEDAIIAWKQVPYSISGKHRAFGCAQTCQFLVTATCYERGARRVLAAHAAPRPARTLRLALDYAFTDAMDTERYDHTTSSMMNFKDFLISSINAIQRALVLSLEDVANEDDNVSQIRRELRGYRMSSLAKFGLTHINYRPTMNKLLFLK